MCTFRAYRGSDGWGGPQHRRPLPIKSKKSMALPNPIYRQILIKFYTIFNKMVLYFKKLLEF